MIFVGDDWAESHHDVYLMDDAGRRLGSRRLPEGLNGIRQLHELIVQHAEEPDQVMIGIETDRGLWVGALTAAGCQLPDGNPRSHVSDSGTTLTDLCGIGALTAGKILGRVGTIYCFRSAAAFATYTGTAPIGVSSGDVIRHRLSRAGDRQLNLCLHVMALAQIRQDTPGRAYHLRKRSLGKSHKEAMRCLKRRLSDVVYRQLLRHDVNRLEAGPGGHSGAALSSSAASSNPSH